MKILKWTSLLVSLLVFAAWGYLKISGSVIMSNGEIESSVASILQTLDERYIYPEVATAMRNAVELKMSNGGYTNIYTDRALIDELHFDLRAVSNDLHLALIPTWKSNTMPLGGPKSRSQNHGIGSVRMYQKDIAYFEIKAFPFGSNAHEALSEAVLGASGATAYIVDLRENRGGSLHSASYLASLFLPPNTSLWTLIDREGELIEEYVTPPDKTPETILSGQLYVLISDNTFSAAEYFVWAMQRNHRAIIVGEKTRGGAHSIENIPIDKYFVLRAPVGRPVIGEEEEVWQAVGLTPDIVVKAESALEVALAEIR